MGDLPAGVRQRTSAGDGDGGPHTPLAQHLARTHHEQAEREHSEQGDDGALGLQADSGDEPEQRPQARLGSQEDPQCEVAERDPDRQIEHRGVKDRSDAQAVGSEHERQRGEQLRRDAACKLACTQCDKHGGGHPRRNTGQAQRHERRAGEVDRDASDQRGDEREVDVAQGEVPAGLKKVQLIAVPAVASEERERERELHDRGQHSRPEGVAQRGTSTARRARGGRKAEAHL